MCASRCFDCSNASICLGVKIASVTSLMGRMIHEAQCVLYLLTLRNVWEVIKILFDNIACVKVATERSRDECTIDTSKDFGCVSAALFQTSRHTWCSKWRPMQVPISQRSSFRRLFPLMPTSLDTQIYMHINDDDAGAGPVEIFLSLNETPEINEKSINTGSGLRPGRDHILVAKVPEPMQQAAFIWN